MSAPAANSSDGAICPNCGGPIAVRNPTGHCDHLYYPDYLPRVIPFGPPTKPVPDRFLPKPWRPGG